MADLSSYIPQLLDLVRRKYPGWDDFAHPGFCADETVYKRQTSDAARESLSRDKLRAFLDAADYAGFYDALYQIAKLKTDGGTMNLLWNSVPRDGDMSLIKREEHDAGSVCRAVFDLLQGGGDAADRLEAFNDLAAANGWPRKWAFPTFYLWLLHPDQEVFVKPSLMQWLAKFTGGTIPYDSSPSAATYIAIRDGCHALLDALRPYGAADMIDVQSFIYIAHKMATAKDPFEQAVARLQEGLTAIDNDPYLRGIRDGGDEVYARFRPLFSANHLPALTADEFTPFSRFQNQPPLVGH